MYTKVKVCLFFMVLWTKTNALRMKEEFLCSNATRLTLASSHGTSTTHRSMSESDQPETNSLSNSYSCYHHFFKKTKNDWILM